MVWGWDRKDSSDHYGYQGALVGWPFSSNSGANCIVWLTGEEGYLECIKTVGTTKRRTIAGFWGYGQWSILTGSPSICPAIAVPSDDGLVGPSRSRQ